MKEINRKLIAVQQALKAPKSQFNEFNNFNYRSAEDILEAVKPLLAEQGLTLVLSDTMEYVGDRYYIKTTATLSDGEDSIVTTAYAREDSSRAGMSESQVTGCSSSYARKYCLNGLFLIDDGKDSDSFNNKKATQQPTQVKTKEEILKEFCAGKKATEPKDKLLGFYQYYTKKDWSGKFDYATAERLYSTWGTRPQKEN